MLDCFHLLLFANEYILLLGVVVARHRTRTRHAPSRVGAAQRCFFVWPYCFLLAFLLFNLDWVVCVCSICFGMLILRCVYCCCMARVCGHIRFRTRSRMIAFTCGRQSGNQTIGAGTCTLPFGPPSSFGIRFSRTNGYITRCSQAPHRATFRPQKRALLSHEMWKVNLSILPIVLPSDCLFISFRHRLHALSS